MPLWLQARVVPIELDRRLLLMNILENGQVHLLPLYEKHLGVLDWTDVPMWKEELRVLFSHTTWYEPDLAGYARSVDYLLTKVPALMDPAHVASYPWHKSDWHPTLKMRLLRDWPATLDHLPIDKMLLGYGNREFRAEEEDNDTRTEAHKLLLRLEPRIAKLSAPELNALALKVTKRLTYWQKTLGVEVVEMLQRCGASRASLQTTGLIWNHGSHAQLLRLLNVPGGVDLHTVEEHSRENLLFRAQVELAFVQQDGSYSWMQGDGGVAELKAIICTLGNAGVKQQNKVRGLDVQQVVTDRIAYNERQDAESCAGWGGGGGGGGGGSSGRSSSKSCTFLR